MIEPEPLNELLPEWGKNPPPICVPVTRDEFYWLRDKERAMKLPVVPPQMHNHGNFIVSLGALCAWLAPQAEALGVEIYPGFAAAEPLFNEAGAVCGVRIGDMGVAKDGSHKPGYTPGIDITAPITVLGEGARGHLSKQLIAKYALDKDCDPQTWSIGIKELWQLPPGRTEAGKVVHTLGWPADNATYGGSFIYHLDQDRVAIGYVTGLDYSDPLLSPFELFQQLKNHPSVKPLLEGGSILSYGARALAAGGWQSLPKCEMPGALLIGDAAGLLNVPKIKGTHQAIRSGMLAAEHIAATGVPEGWDAKLRASAVAKELHKVRNIKPGFHKGLWFGLANAGWETLTAGLSPWTLKNHADWKQLHKVGRVRTAQARFPRTHTAAARPPGLGVFRRDRARRGPARAPQGARHEHLRHALRRGIPEPVPALLPGRGLRDRQRRRRQAPADQCRKLRALQDLRHQGSLPDHHLGHAGRRCGTELPEPVKRRSSWGRKRRGLRWTRVLATTVVFAAGVATALLWMRPAQLRFRALDPLPANALDLRDSETRYALSLLIGGYRFGPAHAKEFLFNRCDDHLVDTYSVRRSAAWQPEHRVEFRPNGGDSGATAWVWRDHMPPPEPSDVAAMARWRSGHAVAGEPQLRTISAADFAMIKAEFLALSDAGVEPIRSRLATDGGGVILEFCRAGQYGVFARRNVFDDADDLRVVDLGRRMLAAVGVTTTDTPENIDASAARH